MCRQTETAQGQCGWDTNLDKEVFHAPKIQLLKLIRGGSQNPEVVIGGIQSKCRHRPHRTPPHHNATSRAYLCNDPALNVVSTNCTYKQEIWPTPRTTSWMWVPIPTGSLMIIQDQIFRKALGRAPRSDGLREKRKFVQNKSNKKQSPDSYQKPNYQEPK